MLNNVQSTSDDALDQFTASQAKPAARVTKEFVADDRLIKIDTPQLFRSTEDAVGISALFGAVYLAWMINAMAKAEWRPR